MKQAEPTTHVRIALVRYVPKSQIISPHNALTWVLPQFLWESNGIVPHFYVQYYERIYVR
jgi:hypothetical protein